MKRKNLIDSLSLSFEEEEEIKEEEEFDIYKGEKYLSKNNISVSTISLDNSLGCKIKIYDLAKHIKLKEDGIAYVKYPKDGKRYGDPIIRSIIPYCDKGTKCFFNQITIKLRANKDDEYITLKLFVNGTIHATGCKDIHEFESIRKKIIKIIKKYNKKKKIIDGKINVGKISISMINSNFNVGYEIDKIMLYRILIENHNQESKDKKLGYIKAYYKNNANHSCTEIEHNYEDNICSIYIFKTGSIIITGAKKYIHIKEAHKYLLKILDTYYSLIKIDNNLSKAMIKEIKKYTSNKL